MKQATCIGVTICLIFLMCTSAPADPTLLWSDEFDGSGEPDPAVWTHDLGNWGWGNWELQNYTNSLDNVKTENGHLTITARLENDGSFTSGRIQSQDKLMFQYGTVEARIRIPDLASGLWPAFWTLGRDFSSAGWPHCGEIDILEMGAADAIANDEINQRVYSTAHWGIDGNYAGYGLHLTMETDLNDDFHVWRMEWTPDFIRTFVDEQPIWVIDISDPDSFSGHEFHAPHFLIINLAVGGTFTGIMEPEGITATLPAQYLVDYVRIYDNGYTMLDGTAIECPADCNDDGSINVDDLLTIIGDWGDPYDVDDLLLVISEWGNTCP